MIDKAAAEKSLKTRFRNFFSGNKGKETTSEESLPDIKSLSQHQHKQYRLFTLRFYLTVLDDIVTGKYRNDPCKFIRDVFNICAQVFNCALFYDDGQHFWKVEEVKEVIVCMYM